MDDKLGLKHCNVGRSRSVELFQNISRRPRLQEESLARSHAFLPVGGDELGGLSLDVVLEADQ